MMKFLRVALALLLLTSHAAAQGSGQLGSGQVWGNSTAARAQASPNSISAMLDRAIGSTRGSIIERGASTWGAITPGTSGLPFVSAGSGADPAYAILGLSGGGTNAALTASNGGVVYSTGSALAILSGTVTAGQCLLSGSSAAPTWGSCAGGAAVSSVTATDSTLTISPTTGSVLAGINLANANAWTAAQTIASSSAGAFKVGLGVTNPAFNVDASTASSATGLNIKSAAAAGGVALSVISSGTNENLTVDAKGSGTITLGGTSTGAITLTRATTLSAALTYGGVTLSNAVTGTGNMVLSASPTFSGTVAGNNTIPLSILAQVATNTVLGNSTSGTANVTALSVGGCSSASSALIWTTNTGFGCNTSITAAAMAASGLTGQVALANGGTAANLTASNGGIFYSTGSAGAILAGTVTAGQCLLSGSSAAPTWGSCSSGAAVTDVTAANSTLTISPTTGSVVAGINLGNSNAWTAAQTIAVTNAGAFQVGLGLTNPALNVDTSTASSATGLNIKSAAAAGGLAISVISSGTNEGLAINAKGSGTINLGTVSTGGVGVTGAFVGSTSVTAFGVMATGVNGITGGQLTLNGSTSGSGVLKVAAAAGSGIVFQLPSANGSANNFLKTDGAGVTSWSAVAASGLTGQVALANGGTGTAITASNGGIVYSDASQLQLLAGTVTANQCLLSGSSAAPSWGSCSGGAAVTDVTAGNSSLTISPTTGSVVASINLANSNAWTALQTIAVTNAGAFKVGLGLTNPAFNVDTSTGSSATGLNIKSAAAAGGLALSVISSGTNEALTINAKGSGTIGIGSVSTGAVTITPALTAASTIASGTNGGTGGQLTLNGSTSGSGVLKVAAAAGSAIVFQLPSSNGSNTNFLQTNGSGVTSWAAAVTSVTCGTGLTGGAITTTGTCAVDYATTSNVWSATASKSVPSDVLNSAGALTALTDGATVAVDMSLGVNFSLTIGGNRTLGAPSNTQVGRTGCIFITQDGTGSRTLAYHANWKFASGTAPVLTTTAAAVDMLCYIVRTSTSIVGSLTKDVK